MKKQKYMHVLLRVLMVCCAIGIGYLLFGLLASNHEYAQGDAVYAQVRAMRDVQRQQVQVQPQDAEKPAGVDFDALRAVNPEVTAWLSAEDSVIDYPLVQGQDNDHYLTHLFTGEKNKLGALFMDYRVPSDFSGKSTVIYGHNMKDGSMFASLIHYQKQEYYIKHPVMQLSTPEQAYELTLFAGIVGDGSYEFVRFAFARDADFLAYVDELKAASTFQSDVTVGAEDRIVALVTCSYAFTNARYALFGKLTPTT